MTMLNGYSNVTERLKRVVVLSQGIAKSHGHDAVGPVHLTIGLIAEGEGVAATALRFHGFDLASFKDDVNRLLPPTQAAATSMRSTLALTDDAHTALRAAQFEAVALGHSYLGTEHLVLGMLSDPHTALAQLFEARGFFLTEARARIRWILEYDPHNPAPYAPARAV